MPNSATALTRCPIGLAKSGAGIFVVPTLVIIDTTGADLTVFTPSSGKRWALVGWQYTEGSAHNLTVKSGSTELVTYEFAANQGRNDKIGEGIILSGLAENDALVIQSSVAISKMLMYLTEYKEIVMR
jgi:hypothetical protein